MKEYIAIGSSPAAEDCVQISDPNYNQKSRIELKAFIEAIRKKLGQEPIGAHLAIKANPHDFGTYHEIVCYYDNTNELATEYAFKCESESPEIWDEVGMSKPI